MTATHASVYALAQRGAIRRVLLSEDDIRALERDHPELVIVEGDALLIGEPLPERVDLHYAFPDEDAFAHQFPSMLARLAGHVSIADAPLGLNMRVEKSCREKMEPVLLELAFAITREWLWLELNELPTGAAKTLPAGFALRAAAPRDVEAIVQLIYDSFDDPTVNPRSWAAAVIDIDRVVRVLVDAASRLAGLLHLRGEDATTGYVSELAVHPDFQRRGLGEALMRWAFAWFRDQGYGRVALTTSPDNDRAIALYRKLGFTVTEEGADYRRSLDEDEVRQTLARHKQRTH